MISHQFQLGMVKGKILLLPVITIDVLQCTEVSGIHKGIFAHIRTPHIRKLIYPIRFQQGTLCRVIILRINDRAVILFDNNSNGYNFTPSNS